MQRRVLEFLIISVRIRTDSTYAGSFCLNVSWEVLTIYIRLIKKKNKITLSLKQSSCASVDAFFLQEYFLVDEKISNLQSSDITEIEGNWVEKFFIGSLVKGTIQEQNVLGVVVHFENINNVLGFIPQYHMGGANLEHGSVVHAIVLDLSRAERLVDLSLRPELINNITKEASNSQSKKKRKRSTSKELEIHQKVGAVVEIVKEQYLVLPIPEHGYTIGYASVSDYNTQKLPAKQFSTGQRFTNILAPGCFGC